MGIKHSAVHTERLANVAAGSASNDTFYYYIDMQKEGVYYRKTGLQFEWTAGGAGGTVTVTLEGTLQDDGTAQASCTYQDVTTGLLGVASKTDDFIFSDDDEATACFRYLRVKVVTLLTDGTTAWTLYLKQVA